MRILVLGRNGQLARRISAVQEPGIQCLFMGREDCDLSRTGTIRSAIASVMPDVIINTAAYTAVDQAEDEPDLAWAINVIGPEEAARAAAGLDIPFLHVSTDYVFDGTREGAYVETDSTAPLGVYGKSKRAGEEAVLAAAPRSAIFRTAWLYAPEGANFVKTMLRLAGDHDELRVVSDQTGSPTYAGDLASFLIRAAQQCVKASDDVPCFGIFHAAGGGSTSWASFAEAIVERGVKQGLIATAPMIKHITTAEFPTRAARPANSVLDSAKLREVFGTGLRDWQGGLDTMIAELARQGIGIR